MPQGVWGDAAGYGVTATRVTAVSALRLPLHLDLAIVVDGHGALGDDQADVVALPLVQNHRDASHAAGHGVDRRTTHIGGSRGHAQQVDSLPVRGVQPLKPRERIANNPLKGFCHNAVEQFDVLCDMQSCLARRTGSDASASTPLR